MYKWKLDFILKSGKELTAFYENDKDGSLNVGKELLEGEDDVIIGSLNDRNKTQQIFIRRGDIASMAVSIGQNR